MSTTSPISGESIVVASSVLPGIEYPDRHSSGKHTMSDPAEDAASHSASILERLTSVSPRTEFIDTMERRTPSIISPLCS